ncbi:MAG: 5-formyltetrahydrofolate cyclo-ligase [Carbonactinosporaceae bacterium]
MTLSNDKAALRSRLLHSRATISPERRQAAAGALRDVLLSVPEVQRARTVAAYLAVGREPGTAPALAALHGRGVRVLLPVLCPDNDLDWAAYGGEGSLVQARRGLREPSGPHLGLEAVAAADALLVPALAVDRSGRRLGRGGGSYDRALGRVPADRFTVALLYDGEVLDAVPGAPHDRHVRAAATPSGLLRFTGWTR